MINTPTTRRAVLAASAAGGVSAAALGPIPIIDSHFHLYDPTRPQGSPFPFTPNAPPFLPKHFRESAIAVGVAGGIKVEASPWVEDNLWVLMMIESEPMITGMIGNLDPLKPEFREYLDRYRKNKLFLGIRYGNVWPGHDLVAAIDRPELIENMKAFAATGLTLEVANPRVDLTRATVRLLDKVPELRVVLGHQQALGIPEDAGVQKQYTADLEELRKRKVYVKMSGLYRPKTAVAGSAPEAKDYQPVADFLWEIFGEDYLIFAGRNKATIEILRSYFLAKSRAAAEKYFWRNSALAFRWIRRDPGQPEVAA